MIILVIFIWILFGLLGCYISNKHILYQDNIVKYIWNTLVALNGIFGLMLVCMMYISLKILK